MISFPRIQIEQQFARISFKAEHGTLEQEQPYAQMDFQTTLPKVEIEQPNGELYIDQSRAWAAYGTGNHLENMLKVYDQAKQIGLETIGNIAARGDRLAAIHTGEDAVIANITHYSRRFAHEGMIGPASSDNVSITYVANPVRFNPIEGVVDTKITKSEPINRYTKGNFDFSMQQYAKVTITPPPPRMNIQL